MTAKTSRQEIIQNIGEMSLLWGQCQELVSKNDKRSVRQTATLRQALQLYKENKLGVVIASGNSKGESDQMFRNWRAISAIKDRFVMWAMALVDLDTKEGKTLAARFPEYFSGSEPSDIGPVPISVMIELATWHDDNPTRQEAARNIVCFGGVEEDIPLISFCICEDCDAELPILPPELETMIYPAEANNELHVGQMFVWQGKQIVLLARENCGKGEDCEYYFAPADTVLIDETVLYTTTTGVSLRMFQ